MAIANFINGESLSSVRTKLNTTIDEVNKISSTELTLAISGSVSSDESFVIATASGITITLPDLTTATKLVKIINTSAGSITIDGFSSDTIDGNATFTLYAGKSLHIYPNTTDWLIAGGSGSNVSSPSKKQSSISTNTSVTDEDIIIGTADLTLTLPTKASRINGSLVQPLTIKAYSGTITLSEAVESVTTITAPESITITTDGTNWMAIEF